MFSETRYALNGDLHVAYRASAPGERDVLFLSNWFTHCEVVPEMPLLSGWIEAMTSLGRLIFFRPTRNARPTPPSPGGAEATLEQWTDSISAVLDDLGSPEAVLIAVDGAFATGALFAATHPSRTTALVSLEGGYADVFVDDTRTDARTDMLSLWGSGELQRLINPDMPWNEEIRASWARMERLAASPGVAATMLPFVAEMNVRAVLPSVRVPTLVLQHADDPYITPAMGRDIAHLIPDAEYVELPGSNMYHFVEPWRESFQVIAEFVTGEQASVADERVLATVLFTDIVDSTRRASTIGDRDWHALLDAHDAVVRAQLTPLPRPRSQPNRRRLPRHVRRTTTSHPLRHGHSRRRARPRHRNPRRPAHR